MHTNQDKYDVVICGAGLAGLTLARQLLLQIPDQRILLIDRLRRPLPEAAHKVGESTVHPGGTYLCNVLKLKEYLDTNQLEKYGLRYFFGKRGMEFSSRAELGRGVYDEAILEHQLDRGVFENDLRQMVVDAGAELEEGAVLQDIEIGQGETDHVIRFKAFESSEIGSVKARWVIDATGRRQFISRKLNLREEFPENCSSSWMRVKGRFDVSDLVPSSNSQWHDRVSHDHPFLDDYGRYNSTNHIMGFGYWIWIIPLVSGYTSIGVVTHNDYHDFSTHNSLEKNKKWLEKHDPVIADHLKKFEILDFKVMANYAHTSSRVYSADRWACTGEAGVFADPFQSPGTDTIAISNCYIKELIQSDIEGKLTPELVDSVNQELLDYSQTLTKMIQSSYPAFFNETVGTLSVMWYLAWTMSFIVPNMRFRIYPSGFISDHGAISKDEYSYIQKINALGLRISHFIRDWALAKHEQNAEQGFDWMSHWDVSFFGGFRDRMLSQDSPQWQGNLEKLSHFAVGIFYIAIEEIYPDRFDSFASDFVPNVQAISMNPDSWESDGLFSMEHGLDYEDCEKVKNDLKDSFYSLKTEVAQ